MNIKEKVDKVNMKEKALNVKNIKKEEGLRGLEVEFKEIVLKGLYIILKIVFVRLLVEMPRGLK